MIVIKINELRNAFRHPVCYCGGNYPAVAVPNQHKAIQLLVLDHPQNVLDVEPRRCGDEPAPGTLHAPTAVLLSRQIVAGQEGGEPRTLCRGAHPVALIAYRAAAFWLAMAALSASLVTFEGKTASAAEDQRN